MTDGPMLASRPTTSRLADVERVAPERRGAQSIQSRKEDKP